MLRAAQAIVEKVLGLMEGHDTSHVGIYDTKLGGRIAKQANTEEQGHPEGRDTVANRMQAEKTTRKEQRGQGEDGQHEEEGEKIVAEVVEVKDKGQEEKAQVTEPQGKQRQPKRTVGSGGNG